jgi:hypothetical protein
MITFLVFAIGLLFLFLPFIPSVIEVSKPSDSKALKITNHILRDPRSSPEFLYWHFAHLLGTDSLETLENMTKVTDATLLNESILAIPGGEVGTIPKTVARVLSSQSIQLQTKTTYLSKIVSLRSIETGTSNALNEIHAKERLTIGSGSKVMWWASGAEIVLKDKLDLPGKIQATKSIEIEGAIQFHHLEAPRIAVGNDVAPAVEFVALPLVVPRHSFNEHCEIKANTVLEGDLIVKGNLILHENARIHGSVKCHKLITLKRGARITGNMISLGDAQCEGNNWIGGTVLVQKTVSFGNGTFIGSENQRVTVSANRIEISGSFTTHGTMRAWTRGSTKTRGFLA